MKKLLNLALAVMMMVGLTGCSSPKYMMSSEKTYEIADYGFTIKGMSGLEGAFDRTVKLNHNVFRQEGKILAVVMASKKDTGVTDLTQVDEIYKDSVTRDLENAVYEEGKFSPTGNINFHYVGEDSGFDNATVMYYPDLFTNQEQTTIADRDVLMSKGTFKDIRHNGIYHFENKTQITNSNYQETVFVNELNYVSVAFFLDEEKTIAAEMVAVSPTVDGYSIDELVEAITEYMGTIKKA